ncbi:MAG: helix-turn-helix transcriptional regulator [Dehalococcoidia bacterium]|nr:helix-turn-helix transcriptional regulator [Dehalococcoidia bacterium]
MRPHHYQTRNRHSLTQRQEHVLDLVCRGYTNQQIADDLEITLDGAKWHISEILRKLDVATRDDAAAYWREHNGLRERLRRGIAVLGLAPVRWVATVAGVSALGIAAIFVAMMANTNSGEDTPQAEPTAMSALARIDTGHDLAFVVDEITRVGGVTQVSYHLEGDLNGISFLPGPPDDPLIVPGLEIRGGAASGTVTVPGEPDVLRFPMAVRRVEREIRASLPISAGLEVVVTTVHGEITAKWLDSPTQALKLEISGRDALVTLSEGTSKGTALLDDLGNIYSLEHNRISTPAAWDDGQEATALLTFNGALDPTAETVTLIVQTYDALIIGEWTLPVSVLLGP